MGIQKQNQRLENEHNMASWRPFCTLVAVRAGLGCFCICHCLRPVVAQLNDGDIDLHSHVTTITFTEDQPNGNSIANIVTRCGDGYSLDRWQRATHPSVTSLGTSEEERKKERGKKDSHTEKLLLKGLHTALWSFMQNVLLHAASTSYITATSIGHERSNYWVCVF